MKRQYNTSQDKTTQYHIRLDTTRHIHAIQDETVWDKIRQGKTIIEHKRRQYNTSQFNTRQHQTM